MSLRNIARRLVSYNPPDPVRFWRGRASDPGWLSVMWQNSAYNELAHQDQWNAIEQFLPPHRGAVLDLGCGTGRLSRALSKLFDEYTGVDLDTMVQEARRRNPELADRFIEAKFQDYDYPPERFDLVLSMACLCSACRAEEMPETARRMVKALRPGGRIICIDAFHRIPALVRVCRMSSPEVIKLFEGLGVRLEYWNAIHFIPFRLLFARPTFARLRRFTQFMYRVGEQIRKLAPRLWGDYQILVFSKP